MDPHADKDGIWDDVAIPEGTVAGRSNEVLFGSKEGTESNSSKTARASGGGPPASSGFDLSDFSAAAMKFQVDTKEIGAGTADGMGGLEDGIEKYDAVGDATMEDLMKEHNDAHNSEAAFNATGNSSMRSKLLETLNIKDKNLDTKEKEPQSDLLMGVDPALIFGPPKSVMDSPAVAPAASEPAPEPPQAPAVAPALAPAEWFYFDPNQVIQGPFDTASMGKWLEAGYFKPDLPVRLKHWQSFYPLGMLFPDPSTAFRTIPPVEPGMLLPPGHPLHVPSNQVTQQQRQQQLLQEQQRQLQEQQRQQRLMQERQQQDQQRHQEQQRILREQQRQQQQLLLEQQQRQLQERQRQQQQLQEQQRLQQLQEQQRQQQLVADMKEQKRLQEQQQQQQQNKILLDQQQRVQNLLMEQQQKQKRAQQPAKAAEKPKQIKKSEKPAAETAKLSPVPAKSNAPATAAAPWADNTTSQPVKAEVSLAEIQKQESQKAQIEAQKRQQLEESRGLKNGQAWGGSKTEKKASIAEIQQREMLEKVKAQQQQKQQQAAGNKNALANKLKMMVGAGNQNQNTPIVASSNWAEGGVQPRIVPAPKPAPSGASLVDIMEQEKKQYSQGVPSQKATAPHSWAAKIGAQGGYTAPAPVAPTPVAPAAAPTPAQSVQQSRSQKKNAPSALPEAAPVTGANGIPQDMVDWCVAQLQRLQKPLDLTLIAFCLSSVDSASEVREYFADYFGSTPQVSQFASEFIKKREKKGRK